MELFQNQDLFHLLREFDQLLRVLKQRWHFSEQFGFLQYTILDHVIETGGSIPLSELHERLQVEKSTTTRLLAPLIKSELLKSEVNMQSKGPRSKNILVTKTGRIAHQKYRSELFRQFEDIMNLIPTTERTVVLSSLSKLIDALKRCC